MDHKILTLPIFFQDEEDLVDPAVQIKEDCANSAACISSKERLDACNERVNSKENTGLLTYTHSQKVATSRAGGGESNNESAMTKLCESAHQGNVQPAV